MWVVLLAQWERMVRRWARRGQVARWPARPMTAWRARARVVAARSRWGLPGCGLLQGRRAGSRWWGVAVRGLGQMGAAQQPAGPCCLRAGSRSSWVEQLLLQRVRWLRGRWWAGRRGRRRFACQGQVGSSGVQRAGVVLRRSWGQVAARLLTAERLCCLLRRPRQAGPQAQVRAVQAPRGWPGRGAWAEPGRMRPGPSRRAGRAAWRGGAPARPPPPHGRAGSPA
mmetsp:Transcript_12637/g.30979  ORF Transcript_12637/g.30979 Transcript_12637/m.30979 type:complete len:225 (-) Transcript_12637:306-980(-)